MQRCNPSLKAITLGFSRSDLTHPTILAFTNRTCTQVLFQDTQIQALSLLETLKGKVEGLHLLTSPVTQPLQHTHSCRVIWFLRGNYPFKFFQCLAGSLAILYFQAFMVQTSYLSLLSSFSGPVLVMQTCWYLCSPLFQETECAKNLGM